MKNPRKPNREEIKQIEQKLIREGLSWNTYEGLVKRTSVAVFDEYMTDGPGYAGKLMVVVWPSAPELHEVFIWKNGKMVKVEKE